MTTITVLTLLGVAITSALSSDQSAAFPDEQPISDAADHAGESRVETPQVVLQLKYDRGELDKIYLAQFRKPPPEGQGDPSVPTRSSLCADLCHAGLGGAACGSACSVMLPVGLEAALRSAGEVEHDVVYGQPRSAVCPTLCRNQLGEPLCNCSSLYSAEELTESTPHAIDWSGVCDAFCITDEYTLGGCRTCERVSTMNSVQLTSSARILNTKDGWTAWCTLQCRQGHGGAACNCDRSPLQ